MPKLLTWHLFLRNFEIQSATVLALIIALLLTVRNQAREEKFWNSKWCNNCWFFLLDNNFTSDGRKPGILYHNLYRVRIEFDPKFSENAWFMLALWKFYTLWHALFVSVYNSLLHPLDDWTNPVITDFLCCLRSRLKTLSALILCAFSLCSAVAPDHRVSHPRLNWGCSSLIPGGGLS